jgi:putative tryptophan/tyrosine transport system substrate-binding protein
MPGARLGSMEAGMRRRHFLRTLLTVAAALHPFAGSNAQQRTSTAKTYRIGLLWPGVPESKAIEAGFAAFRSRLRELGYMEDESVAILHRFAAGRLERLPELALELVAANVDVIVAVAIPSSLAAREATPSIPIVMVHAGNPIGTGLIESLARPGGNVTGTTSIAEELGGKQLEILHQLRPDAARIAFLFNPTNSSAQPMLRNVEVAAALLRLEVVPVEVVRSEDFDSAFGKIREARVDSLLVLVDAVAYTARRRIIAFAARARLPALYTLSWPVRDGGLLSYGPNLDSHYDIAAVLVDKILKGAKPADLPVEQPTRFELVINLKTAKVLGLTIPPALLARADEVIE